MSKIKNGLDQYGAESYEWEQFGTAGIEGVKAKVKAKANLMIAEDRPNCTHFIITVFTSTMQ